MPTVQSAYPETMRAAVEGMVANTEPKNVISRTVETVAGVAFGRAVIQGADDHGIIIPAVAGGVFRGITIRDVTLPQDETDVYPQYDDAGLLEKGVMWVVVQEAAGVNAGDPLSFDVAGGAFHTTIDATHEAVPGGTWESSAAIGELAKVRLS